MQKGTNINENPKNNMVADVAVTNNAWIPFEKSLPPVMTEVLLFIPDPETGLGYIRVGYYDPDGERIAIASIPINTQQTELLGLMDKISQNNVTCNGATHWKSLGEFPSRSEYVAARTSSMVIAQMSIVDNINLQ